MSHAEYGLGFGAYFGAAFNTSDSSNTDLVPSIFPIAIDGKPYNLDLFNPSGGNFYRRDSIALLRTQADNARTAGESSVSPEIFWRRSFDSWHLGAGQTHADRETSSPYRFRSSKGMDVWDKGELKALNDVTTQNGFGSPNESIGLAVAGSRLYVYNGTATKYTSSTSGTWSWTTVTGSPAETPTGIASDGKKIWIAYPSAIYETDTASSAMTSLSTAPSTHTWTGIWFNKDHLFASASDGSMYEIPANGTEVEIIGHHGTEFIWTASTGVGGFHYFAGTKGDKSVLYKITLTNTGTALGAGIVCGELPDGEFYRIFLQFEKLGKQMTR